MMWGPLLFSGLNWEISLALKDPKLLVSDFTSDAEFPHPTGPKAKPQKVGDKSF